MLCALKQNKSRLPPTAGGNFRQLVPGEEVQVGPLITLDPSQHSDPAGCQEQLPSCLHSVLSGRGPETAPLRMVFLSCHLQNLPTVIDARLSPDAKQVKGLGLPFSQQTN